MGCGVKKMPDYKEMYLKMVRATEEAMNLLIAAQRECEEIYINSAESAEPRAATECGPKADDLQEDSPGWVSKG